MNDFKCSIFASDKIASNKLSLIQKFNGCLHTFSSDVSDKPGGWIYEASSFSKNNSNTLLIDQFNNIKNVLIHTETTAPEIANFFNEKNIELDIIFVGLGSGGTAEGILDFFEENYPHVKVIILEPKGGVAYSYYNNLPPNYIDHRVEAISDRFLPQNIKDIKRYSDVHQYKDDEMEKYQEYLMKEEGLFVGEATGFIASASLDYIKKHNLYGKKILFLATDNGYRYI